MTAEQLISTLARLRTYQWPEGESWTDDQAEDAITSLNRLISEARAIIGEPLFDDEDDDSEDDL